MGWIPAGSGLVGKMRVPAGRLPHAQWWIWEGCNSVSSSEEASHRVSLGTALGIRGALAPGTTAHQRWFPGESPRSKLGSEAGAKQTQKWLSEGGRGLTTGKGKPGGGVLVMALLGSFWHQMVTFSEAFSLLWGQNQKQMSFGFSTKVPPLMWAIASTYHAHSPC